MTLRLTRKQINIIAPRDKNERQFSCELNYEIGLLLVNKWLNEQHLQLMVSEALSTKIQ